VRQVLQQQQPRPPRRPAPPAGSAVKQQRQEQLGNLQQQVGLKALLPLRAALLLPPQLLQALQQVLEAQQQAQRSRQPPPPAAAVAATRPWMRTGGSRLLVRRPQVLPRWQLQAGLCLAACRKVVVLAAVLVVLRVRCWTT
jgi:hypothetical protein